MTMTRAEVERICKEARDAGEFPYLSGLVLRKARLWEGGVKC